MEISTVLATPMESVKALIFKNNITEAVQTAALGLQKVPVIENELQKVELDGYINHAKKIRTQVETLRKTETAKLDDAKKLFMAAEKEFAGQLDSEIAAAIARVTKFNQDALAAKRAEEKRIKDEAEAKAKRLRSPESLAKVEMESQAQLQNVATVGGIKTIWKFEIQSPSMVPDTYLMPNEKAIADAVKNGVRTIPGVRIYEDVSRTGR